MASSEEVITQVPCVEQKQVNLDMQDSVTSSIRKLRLTLTEAVQKAHWAGQHLQLDATFYLGILYLFERLSSKVEGEEMLPDPELKPPSPIIT